MEILTLIAIAISSAVQIHILIRLIAPEVGSYCRDTGVCQVLTVLWALPS